MGRLVTRTTTGWGMLLALTAAAAALLPGSVRADKGINEGTFRDSTGKEHAWTLERSHLLTWGGQPYAPAGLVFNSAFLKEPSDQTFQQDQQELDRLKAAGVQDLWIEPQRGLLQTPVAQLQTLLDAVDSRGFRYGLRVGDGSREPLLGFHPRMKHISVPVEQLQPGGKPTWTITTGDARRLIYHLVGTSPDERTHNWTVTSGETEVGPQGARIQVQLKPTSKLLGKSRGVLLVVPEVQVEPEELGSFGDLWEGMEAYSGRLKKYLAAVKFGPGFRFLLDPFYAGDGTLGQEDGIFPSSPMFRAGFKEYLQRRGGVSAVNIRWRTTDRQILGVEEACRVFPMWPRNDAPDGDGWLYDPVERVAYRCLPRESRIWEDLDNYRAEWLRRWMNNLSTTLKQETLDVPILFSWTGYHPLFNNSPSPNGYDGLGGHIYGSPDTVARSAAAYALAQVEEADRNTWLVATRLAGAPDTGGNPTPIKTGEELNRTWQGIRDAGFRGFYLDPKQVPDAVGMVKSVASSMGDSATMQAKPQVLFFPMPLATADRLTKLSSGVWWLPSGMPARLLRYGDGLLGYQIDRPFGEEHVVRDAVVLWSTVGKRTATFYWDGLAQVAFFDATGKPLKIKPNKREEIKLNLNDEPIILTGLDATTLFPLELVHANLQEFDELLTAAEALKQDTRALRFLYEEAKKQAATNSAGAVYNTILPYLVTLRQAVSPYTWLEGERVSAHNLNGVAFQAGCSSGTFLKLDRKSPPPSGEFKVRYPIELRRDSTYEIWVAGKVPGRPGVSPLVWQIDEEPEVPVTQATPTGTDYTPGMAWYSLGKTTLKAGKHELTFTIRDKAAGTDGKYVGGIDVVVLSRDPFKPSGIEKPYGKPQARK